MKRDYNITQEEVIKHPGFTGDIDRNYISLPEYKKSVSKKFIALVFVCMLAVSGFTGYLYGSKTSVDTVFADNVSDTSSQDLVVSETSILEQNELVQNTESNIVSDIQFDNSKAITPDGQYSDDAFQDLLLQARTTYAMEFEENPDEYIVTQTEEELEENRELEIIFDDDVSEEHRALFYEYLSYEPQVILDSIARYQVPIRIAPSDKYTNGHAGIYSTNFFGFRRIGLNCATNRKLIVSVNHEIGHCVDEIIGQEFNLSYYWAKYGPGVSVFISNCDEFQEIFAAEVDNAGYPEWNSTCSSEFFAETYRHVVEHNTGMLARVPRAAEFVARMVNEVYGTDFQAY